MMIDGKACNKIPEAVNKLAKYQPAWVILVKLSEIGVQDLFVIFQVSLPYSRTDRTFDLRSFILVFLPNWLLFHTDLRLLYANLAQIFNKTA
jgi:hypothetical protein